MHFREGSGRWSPLTGLWAPGRQAWLCLRGSGVREAWVPQELEVRRGGRSASAARSVRPSGAAQAWPGALFVRAKRWACQEWDSNPRLQGRLRPERSALDRSAILTAVPGSPPLAWLGADANRRALGLARARAWRLAGGCVRAPRDATGARADRTGSQVSRRPWLGLRRRRPRARPRPPPARLPRSRGAARAHLPHTRGLACPRGPLPPGTKPASGAIGSARSEEAAPPASLPPAPTPPLPTPLPGASAGARPAPRTGRGRGPLCWATGLVGLVSGRGRARARGGRPRRAGVRGQGRRRPAAAERSGVRAPAAAVLVSIVVSIPACHAGDRGSIPRRGGQTPFLVAGAALRPSSRSPPGTPSCPPSALQRAAGRHLVPSPPTADHIHAHSHPHSHSLLPRGALGWSPRPSQGLLSPVPTAPDESPRLKWLPPWAPGDATHRCPAAQLPSCRDGWQADPCPLAAGSGLAERPLHQGFVRPAGGRVGRSRRPPAAARQRERPPEAVQGRARGTGATPPGGRPWVGGACGGAERQSCRAAELPSCVQGVVTELRQADLAAGMRSCEPRAWRLGPARAVQRWWYSGEHSCLPSS